VLILPVTRLAATTKEMIEPAHNPVFFTYAFLSLNAEWIAYSVISRSVVDPIVKGIHKKSDRASIKLVNKVKKISKMFL